jgi:hypothetical protein
MTPPSVSSNFVFLNSTKYDSPYSLHRRTSLNKLFTSTV